MPTKIQWCDETWSPVTGCTPVSEGCRSCYAKRFAKRLAGRWGYPVNDPFQVVHRPEKLDDPVHWDKPRRIFVCSMGDLFHEDVQTEFIAQVFRRARMCSRHRFVVLTKRPKRMREFILSGEALQGNVWLGVSVENQKAADERIPELLKVPAAVRFVSCEPLIGPVDIRSYLVKNKCWRCLGTKIYQPSGIEEIYNCPECAGTGEGYSLDWVIVGGETGPGARPMHPVWPRVIRDDCFAANVPFFFKSWGNWKSAPDEDSEEFNDYFRNPQHNGYWVKKEDGELERPTFLIPVGGLINTIYESELMMRVGKKKAGRMLDGKEWNEWPSQ